MTTARLCLEHPLEQLELDNHDLDPRKWDILRPPALFRVEGSAVCEYMPPMELVQMEGKGRIERIEGGELVVRFRLTQSVNWMWQLFFEKHRGEVKVVLEQKSLVIRCGYGKVKESYERVFKSAIPRATRAYMEEREKLVWEVFSRMEERAAKVDRSEQRQRR